MQGARKIVVTAAQPVELQRAILNPLAMGSRGRCGPVEYSLVS